MSPRVLSPIGMKLLLGVVITAMKQGYEQRDCEEQAEGVPTECGLRGGTEANITSDFREGTAYPHRAHIRNEFLV